ncbi:MAG: Verru_Chthon cassette protein B [Rhodospirillales bacterium]|nr:Verru_Chthon cassette protein B [Acetobacter sp.]
MRKITAHAFSLVEVTLALGITAICMVSLFGLLPIGLNTNRNSVEQTFAAGLVGTVIADIRTQAASNARMPATGTAGKSPQYGFDLTVTTVQTIYINADGSATPVPTTALYRISLAFSAPAQPATASPLRIFVSWPAAAGNAPSNAWPKAANVTGSFEVATAVDLTR